jgi:hypothetical protein
MSPPAVDVNLCDDCNKWDNTCMVDGKRYCKVCFDKNGFNYTMMDHVEENRSHFEAMGWKF